MTWNRLNELQGQNTTHSPCQPNLNGLLNRAAGKSEECLNLHCASAAVAIATESLLTEVSFWILTYQPLFLFTFCVLSYNSKIQSRTYTQMNFSFTTVMAVLKQIKYNEMEYSVLETKQKGKKSFL